MSNATRVLIGHVPVDSGQVFIVDPCYVLNGDVQFQGDEVVSDNAYSRACAASMSEDGAAPFRAGVDVNIHGNPITAPDAVCTSTGWGDGMYPVYVTYSDDGRVASMTIEFMEDEDDEWNDDEWED